MPIVIGVGVVLVLLGLGYATFVWWPWPLVAIGGGIILFLVALAGRRSGWGCGGIIAAVLAVAIVAALSFGAVSCGLGVYRWATAPPAPPPQIKAKPSPAEETLFRGTTPTSMTLNFEFNIEADAAVKITYDDGQSYVYTPGVGCIQGPTPTTLGPKKFTDPSNEAEGHVDFRIYKLRPGEGACANKEVKK